MTQTTQPAASTSILAPGQSWDDTREVRKVAVDDLVVDRNVQRPTKEARLREMGDWDPYKAEMITVAERADGTLAVIEGQNRVLKLQEEYPGSKAKVIVRPSPATGYAAEEALVARGIAGGRRQHSAFAKMDLEFKAGDPYWAAAVAALGEWEVSLVEIGQSGPRGIVAVTTIGKLMHQFDESSESVEESIAKASDLLSLTVALIITTWEDKPKMWDRVLIQAVAGLLQRGADSQRLAQKLARSEPVIWLGEADRRRQRISKVRYLATLILNDYNYQLRSHQVTW